MSSGFLFGEFRIRKLNIYALDSILIHAVDLDQNVIVGNCNLVLLRKMTEKSEAVTADRVVIVGFEIVA